MILLEANVGHFDGEQKWISMSIIAKQFHFEDVKINKTFLTSASDSLLIQMVLIYSFFTFQVQKLFHSFIDESLFLHSATSFRKRW